MARGAESKNIVMNKILETFAGSFVYGKELRIPMTENGERVEIKVALICAKVNVGGDAEPSAFASSETPASSAPKTIPVFTTLTAPTEEEKQNIQDLMSKLGI